MPPRKTDKQNQPTGDTVRLRKLELREEEPYRIVRQRGRDPYNTPARQPRRWNSRHEDDGRPLYFVGAPEGDPGKDGGNDS